MRQSLTSLKVVGPVLGAGFASCPWWVIVLVAGLTVFLHGAEPTMRWLDVRDRLRPGRALATSEQAAAAKLPEGTVVVTRDAVSAAAEN